VTTKLGQERLTL